jgi:ADP-ribose pyrophosphatase YjhB (NUDIX family)
LLTQQRFTASAAVVITNGGGKVLLLEHVLRPRSGWGMPGGFLERGEQPDDGIRREIREETGIDLVGLKNIRTRTIGSHIEFIFSATTPADPAFISREIIQWKWFDPADLPKGLPGSQRIIIEKVFSGEFDKAGDAV